MQKKFKAVSVLLVFAMLVSMLCVGFTASAASAFDYTNTEPSLVSAELDKGPENADYNEVITFTVVTDTNTSKVKICREDGSVYTLANAVDGFTGYSDAGDVRTWSIQKRVEIRTACNFRVYAGNCCYGYAANNVLVRSTSETSDGEDCTITLLGDSAEITGTGAYFENGKVYITAGSKTYTVTGTLNDGQIIVDTLTDVSIDLSGVSVTCSDGPAFIGLNGDIDLSAKKGTVNTLTDGATYTDTTYDACVYSSDRLTLKGKGSLTINGNYMYGVNAKDELEAKNLTLNVTAVNDAVRGKDSVNVSGGTITIVSDGGDGLKSTKGTVTLSEEDSTLSLNITADADAIQAETTLAINAGTVNAFGKKGLTATATTVAESAVVISSSRSEFSGVTTASPVMYLNYLTADSIAKDTQISVKKDGNALYSFAPSKKFIYVMVSAPTLESGATYNVYTGGVQSAHSTDLTGAFTLTGNATTFIDVTDMVGGGTDEPTEGSGDIVLNQTYITASGSGLALSESDTVVTVSLPGEYNVSGTLADGRIIVNVDKEQYPEGVVTLNFAGVDLTCLDNSPVYVAAIGDECVISAKKNTVNTVSDASGYMNEDGTTDDPESGAIYSKDDLKIKGSGSLTINGNNEFGLVSKNDIKIYNGNITVNAVGTAIKGKDSVVIGNSDDSSNYETLSVTVKSTSGDAIKSTNETEEGRGVIAIYGGTVNVTSYTDGFQAAQALNIVGGTITVYTYQGYSATNLNSELSAKGIKSDGTLTVSGGTITVNSSDDSLHAAAEINISGGELTLQSGDDGVHSDTTLTVDGGDIRVLNSYEGLEGLDIVINDGEIRIKSSDDGVNAAGGSDGSGTGGGGWNPGGWNPGGGSSGGSYSLTINGGYIYVNADGDGLDSNGTFTITGGVSIVSGPTSGGNGSLDSDGTMTVSGGVVLALTSNGMMEYPTSNYITASNAGITSGQMICVVYNGEVVTAFKANKNVGEIIYSNSNVATLTNCTIYKGGTYSGTLNEDGYGTGGTVTGGTQVTLGSGGGGGRW